MDAASESGKTWVAMASGLSMGAQEAPADLKAEMMVEWLTGEAGGLEVCYILSAEATVLISQDQLEGGRIARLILAGNTLTMPIKGEDDHKPVSCRDHNVSLADHPEKIQRFRPRSITVTSNKNSCPLDI